MSILWSRTLKHLWLFGVFGIFPFSLAWGIPLTGSNGKTVEFYGIKSAGPGGLKLQVTADSQLIELPWDRFDLNRLEKENPVVHEAYRFALGGKSTELNLGAFAPVGGAMNGEPAKIDVSKVPGRYVTRVGRGEFTLQLPLGADAVRGVLLLSIGQDGRSSRYLGGPDDSQWKGMASKLKLAVLVGDFSVEPTADSARQNAAYRFPSFPAKRESGQAVLDALAKFAKDSGKGELETAPLVVYGQDVVGAAFGFNFCQWFPDRVIAAVVSKGAFYSAEVAPDALKVPILFISGEYDDDLELWKATETVDDIFKREEVRNATWAFATEPRTGAGMTPQSHFFAMMFLDRMILARLSPEGKLGELDGTKAFAGDLGTSKISRVGDEIRPFKPEETWLPDGEIADAWEKFQNGEFPIPQNG